MVALSRIRLLVHVLITSLWLVAVYLIFKLAIQAAEFA